MPSPYSPPDVQVQQIQRTRTTPRLAPQLAVAVVGPARAIVTRAVAGTYDAQEEFQARLPDLPDGAVVDPTTVSLILDAEDADGSPLGRFALALDGTDAELLSDDETVRVPASLVLEYSVLSARNNDQVDTLANDDRAIGVPDGVEFTDTDIDFLGRGATLDGSSFLLIDSPASMAGRYRITEFVPTGTAVYTVRLIKVNDENVAEVQKPTEINASSLPANEFVYGYPAAHARTGTEDAAFGNSLGSAASNVILGVGDEGVGVDFVVDIDGSGTTEITGAALTDLLTVFVAPEDTPISVPDRISGDAVVFAPQDPGNPATLQGVNTPLWTQLLAKLEVGDWFRFSGDFRGGGGTELRDYEVIAINATDGEVTLQNTDLGGTGTFALDLGAVGGSGITSIKILRTVRGRRDAANAAGDYFDGVADANVPFLEEILRATPSYIELANELPPLSGAVNTEGEIIRGIPFRNADASYDLVVRTNSGFTGQILASYQAQRTDLSLEGLIDIGDQQDIEERLGLIHPDNPVALMADMVARSGLTSGNRVFFALATDGDTIDDYQAALDTLRSEDVYYIVPATQNLEILQAFWAHVEAQSRPENKHERVLVASTAIATSDRIVPAGDNDPVPQGTIAAITPNTLELTPNDAILGLIKPGMQVKILASDDVNAAVVDTQRVQSVNVSTGDVVMLSDFASDAIGTVYFRVDTWPRTKLEQAEFWRDQAKGFNSKRVMLIRPDEMLLTYTDKTGERPRDVTITVPMYYGCAAFAGLCSSLPPQSPMTNVPVPAINRLVNSNNYFSPDQLNTIAEGGNNILIQDTRNSAARSRHQLTTAVNTLETREFSITKAVDFAAKFFRGSMRPYIGNHNITREFLVQLRGTAEAVLRALTEERVMLEGTQLETLYQDPDQPDGVIVEVGLEVPYPVNRITIKLFI